jgi:hypothetical protein
LPESPPISAGRPRPDHLPRPRRSPDAVLRRARDAPQLLAMGLKAHDNSASHTRRLWRSAWAATSSRTSTPYATSSTSGCRSAPAPTIFNGEPAQ